MLTKQLIDRIAVGKRIEADEAFNFLITQKAVARLEQFKKETASMMFKKEAK